MASLNNLLSTSVSGPGPSSALDVPYQSRQTMRRQATM